MAIDSSIYHLRLGWYIRGQGVELLVNGNDYRTVACWEGHMNELEKGKDCFTVLDGVHEIAYMGDDLSYHGE
jgi:hypothetical protein